MIYYFRLVLCTQNAFDNLEEFSFELSAEKGTFLLTALLARQILIGFFRFFFNPDEPDEQELLAGLDPRTDRMSSVAL